MGEEKLSHFSHEEHPLILIQVLKKEDDDHKEVMICYGCQKQILEPEAYSCIPCQFVLHKTCAELPRKIRHPLHTPHPLVLLKEPPPYYFGGTICDACNQRGWEFFTYHCPSCQFDLDVSCATVGRKLEEEIDEDRRCEHECHEHPLVLQKRPAYFFCDACYKEDKDSSYVCNTCPFWIHKSCASLPKTIDFKHHHNHSLSLAYCLPPGSYRHFTQRCGICHTKIHQNMWIYYCGRCRYLIHVRCATSPENNDPNLDEKRNLADDDDEQQFWKQNLVKLPSAHAAQELIKRFLLINSTRKFRIRSKIVLKRVRHGERFKKFYFGFNPSLTITKKKPPEVVVFCECHRLSLSNYKVPTRIVVAVQDEEVLLCDCCVEPISTSDIRYGCDNCGNYFLHKACSMLPFGMQLAKHPEHPLKLMARTNPAKYFRCNACLRYGNGGMYRCEAWDFKICVRCTSVSLPTTIAHYSHKHRLTQIPSAEELEREICNACGYLINGFAFGCEKCHFYLDYECVLLPPTIKRRWDDHPFILQYPPFFEDPDEFYCIFCEKEMDPNQWRFHCIESGHSFHPFCLPRLGYNRNLTFGQIIKVDNHPHLLTHVPEAKYKSRCAENNRDLSWRKAYECQVCSFALCPSSAAKRWLSSSTPNVCLPVRNGTDS